MTMYITTFRNLKVLIEGSGANVTVDTVKKCGATLRPVNKILQEFDKNLNIPGVSQRHPMPSIDKDIALTTKTLWKGDLFSDLGRRLGSSPAAD